MNRLRRYGLCAFLAAGCGGGPTPPRIDGPYVGLNVVGTVRDGADRPIAGANIEIWARNAGTCAGAFANKDGTSTSNGEFTVTLGAWNVPRDVCLWIAVTPAAGSTTVVADTITVEPARLGYEERAQRVDIVLPSPAR